MSARARSVLLIAAIAPMFASRQGVAQTESNVLHPRPAYHPDADYFDQARTIATTIKACPQTAPPIDEPTTAPATVVSITELTLEGATQVPVEEQDRIAASIKMRDFNGSAEAAKLGALDLVREAWQNDGFFKVEASGESRVLTSNPVSSRIALTIEIREGEQYRLEGITFRGNKAINDASILRDLFPLKDGEIFSRNKFAQGLENLLKAYKVLGYATATSVPTPDFNEGQRTVAFEIDMDEGPRFVVSAINLIAEDENIVEKARQDLPLKAWRGVQPRPPQSIRRKISLRQFAQFADFAIARSF